MDVFDFGKAMTEFWQQGSGFAAEGWAAMMRAVAQPGPLTAMPGLAAPSAEFTKAAEAMREMWAAATAMSASIAQGFRNTQGGDHTAEATIAKILDPRGWLGITGEMDPLVRGLTEGPRLADLWDVERRYASVARAFLELQRRSMEHNAVVLSAWMRAGSQFRELLSVKSSASAPLDSEAMLALWTETANTILIETERSEAFLTTQAQLLRASTELRLQQRDLMEYYGERFGFPTRRELDDVHKSLTELRREVRAMQRVRSEPAAPASAPTLTAKAKPARAKKVKA
jgi:hypothetical protein